MSITIGIYDLFSYTIPALFYLFLINESFRLLGVSSFNITQLTVSTELILVILIVITAYIVGHLLDIPAFRFCYRFLYRKKSTEVTLSRLKERYPTLRIDFEPKDWHILLAILRHRNLEFSRVLDKYEADSIMFRNISFGSLLAAFLSIGEFFKFGNFLLLLVVPAALVVCWMAFDRSHVFQDWFYEGIFCFAIGSGTNLKEVIEYNQLNENKVASKEDRSDMRKNRIPRDK